MIYDQYKAKITQIAKVFEKIKRFRVLILSILLFVAAAVTGILAARGIVYGDDACPTEIVYGETLSYESKAFLGETSYEYYDPQTGKWSSEMPTVPGTYKVRAVSKTTFGGNRHGKEHTFTIHSRDVMLTIAESSLTYGDTPTLVGNLIVGDKVSCDKFEYSDLIGSVSVQPIQSSIVIVDASGRNVTSCYNITAEAKNINVQKRSLTIQTGSADKEYDGTPLVEHSYQITNGTLGGYNGAKDNVEVVSYFAGLTGVGSATNELSIAISNAELGDVTECYNVTYRFGTLTVSKRSLQIATDSATKTYDGSALTCATYDVTGLAAGEYISDVPHLTELTNVGTVRNELEVSIANGDGEDVTHNYDIGYTYGNLTVEKRSIAFESWGAQSEYTSYPLTNETLPDIVSGSLAVTDYFVPVFTGSITKKGTADNTFTVEIFNGNIENVTGNYEISYRYGKLEITTSPLTFTTASATKYYDGTPLTAGLESYEGLMGADRLELTDYASITKKGETDNTATYKVLNEDGEDVTGSYFVEPFWGKLRVEEHPVYIQAEYAEKVYDGTPLTATVFYGISSVQDFPADHTVTATAIGSQTDAGESWAKADLATVKITLNGVDVTENFEILGAIESVLRVTARPVVFITHDCEWTYDGLAHYDGDGMGNTKAYDGSETAQTTDTYSLVGGHTLSIVDGTQTRTTEVGEGLLNVLELAVLDANGKFVTDNYEILGYEYGTLTITPRPFTVRSDSGVRVYNGQPFSVPTAAITAGGLVSDEQQLLLFNYAEFTNVVTNEPNTFECTVVDSTGRDISHNYAITQEYGTLTIAPRKILVNTHTHTWIYDGAAHVDNCQYLSDDVRVENDSNLTDETQMYYPLVDGHQLFVDGSYSTQVQDVTDELGVDNAVCLLAMDADGHAVTDNYTIEYTYGKLYVTARHIHIQTHTHNDWEYDGTEQYDTCEYTNLDLLNGTTLAEGKTVLGVALAEPEFLQMDTYTTVKAVGETKENVLTFKVFTYRNGVMTDTTANYVVEYSYGTLSVLPRELTIKSADAYKIYDGEELIAHEYEIISGSVAPKQNLSVVYTGTQTNAGSCENTYSFAIYDENNEDVTVNYNVTQLFGTLTVAKRDIYVSAKIMNETYGDNWECLPGEFYLGVSFGYGFELVEGHVLTVETSGVPNSNEYGGYLGVGSYINEIYGDTVAIVDAAGNSVLENYNVTAVNGGVNISPRKIAISTKDDEKTYDGTPLCDTNEYTTEDLNVHEDYRTLADGHTMEHFTYTYVTNVEECYEGNNVVTFAVMEMGRDVSANYEITYEKYGTLTITPRPIKVRTHDHTWIYDGTAHADGDDCSLGGYGSETKEEEGYYGLVLDHRLQVTIRTYVTEVSATAEGNNVLEVTVCDANGSLFVGNTWSITANYDIGYEYGTLTITPRPILVTTHSCEWTYDGAEHYDGDGTGNVYDYTNADLTYDNVNYYPLAGRDYMLVSATNRVSAVNVWETEGGLLNESEIRVWRSGKDITDNYEISYADYGTLHILPRRLSVVATSETLTYNGVEQHIEANSFEFAESVDGYVVYPVEGHTLTVRTQGAILKNVGSTEHYIVADSAVVVGQNGSETLDGHNLLENYEITYLDGLLTIVQRPMQIVTHTLEWMYDGEYHADEEAYSSADVLEDKYYLSLVEGHEIQVTSWSAQVKNVWDSRENVVGFAILCDGEDVTYNYELHVVYGMLSVNPRPVLLQTHDHEWIYDGDYHYDCEEGLECAYDGNNLLQEEGYYTLVSGEWLSVTGKGYIRDVSSATENNYVSVEIYDTYGENMTANYAVTQRYGTLKIIPRPVYVTKTHDCEWTYDGEAHCDGDGMGNVYDYTDADLTYDGATYYPLVAGEELRASGGAAVTNVWETAENVVEFRVYRYGQDITDNYTILSEHYGTLSILPCAVTVKGWSETYVYDGTERTVAAGWFEYSFDGYNFMKPDFENTVGENGYAELMSGYFLSVETLGATLTNVGSVPHSIVPETAIVTDAEGNTTLDGHNLLENYTFIYDDSGTLTIEARPIRIVTHTRNDWTYDGQEHFDAEPYTEEKDIRVSQGYYDLVLDHELLCVSDPIVLVNAGSVRNVLEFRIVDGAGNDVTENYDLSGIQYGWLTVNRRSVKFQTHTHTWEYDGYEHSDENSCEDAYTKDDMIVDGVNYLDLLDGHYPVLKSAVSIIDVIWENGEIGSTSNDVTFRIKDADGNDVTSNYKFSYECGTLTLTPRYITLCSDSAEKEYDGRALTAKSYTVESGAFAETDTVKATYTGRQTDAYDDEYPEQNYAVSVNKFSVKVTRDGKNVTKVNYVITYNFGELCVNKRAVTLRSLDDSKEYDGTPLVCHEAEAIDGTSLPTGQIIVGTYTGSQLTVGTCENIFEPAICMRASEKDTTKNYIITVKEYGTLEVTPRRIYVSAMSDEKPYDGTPLTVEAGKVDVLFANGQAEPENHTFAATTTGATCYEIGGAAINTITENTLVVLNGEGENVTENFEVLSWNNGVVNITRRALYLETKSYEKPYDGTPLTDEYAYSDEDLYEGTLFGKTYYKLLSGHSLTVLERVSVQNVWENLPNNNVLVFAVLDENGNDVSENYDMSDFVYGTLSITPLSITIATDGGEKKYDGEALTAAGAYLTGELAPNETYELKATGSQTDVGESYNTYELRILSADGLTETTGNYLIDDTGMGMLTVTARRITVQVHTHHDWIYNGEVQNCTVHGCEYTEGDLLLDGENDTLVSGHTLTFASNGGVQFVTEGEVLNDVFFYVVDADGTPVNAENYDIRTVEGTLKLNALEISVETNSLTWTYDGLAHYDGDGMGNGNVNGYTRYTDILGTGDYLVVDENTLVYLTEIGSVSNEVGLIVRKGGKDVSENYEISYSYGTLTVKKRLITVLGVEKSKIYDGIPLVSEAGEYGQITGDGLLDGHTLTIDTERTELNWAKKVDVILEGKKVTISDGVNNVTDYYEITTVNGSLEIFKRPITVRAASRTETYDGKTTWEIEAGDYNESIYNSLVAGHTVGSVETTGVAEMDPGEYENLIIRDTLVILDENGDDVTECYEVTYKDGVLKINKAKLKIATGDASKEYDGVPLTNPEYTIEGVLDVHEITVNVTGQRTEIGKEKNEAGYTGKWLSTGETFNVEDYYEVTRDFGDLIVYGDNVLVIKPIDLAVHSSESDTLYASDVLEDGFNGDVSITELELKGYFYFAEVTGVQKGVGVSEATIESFVLYDPYGNDVTEEYRIEFLPGTLTITEQACVYVEMQEVSITYDGTPHSIGDYCAIKTFTAVGAEGLTVNLDITDEIMMTGIGKVSTETLLSYVTVMRGGVDVTDECIVMIGRVNVTNGNPNVTGRERMTIVPRKLTINSDSATKLYDGTPLTANSYNKENALKMLAAGHTLEVKISGSQTDVGGNYNTVESVTVYDAEGNDVTWNYLIEAKEGWLRVDGNVEE